MKKRILSVFGTRPEVIKMASVVNALENSEHFDSFICTTSQHRKMQDQMMTIFNLRADIDLNIMKPGQSLNYIAAEVIQKLDHFFSNNHIDMVLVQGDTTTTFAASLAAFNAGIPVAHVEAGLRTYNLQAPFPEEANRQLTSRLANLHFAPTPHAKKCLQQENIDERKIIVTGNTVIDALFYIREKIQREKPSITLPLRVQQCIDNHSPYMLITGHRRESFGTGFQQICQAIRHIAEHCPYWHFIYPVHLNPQVQEPVNRLLSSLPNVHLIDPVDYVPFVYLMDHSKIVLTDSGGVQEEAPSLGKPILVMRDVTERPEGIIAGTAKLVGTQPEKIIHEALQLIRNKEAYDKMANAVNPYGDGYAARRILHEIENYFSIKKTEKIAVEEGISWKNT